MVMTETEETLLTSAVETSQSVTDPTPVDSSDEELEYVEKVSPAEVLTSTLGAPPTSATDAVPQSTDASEMTPGSAQ